MVEETADNLIGVAEFDGPDVTPEEVDPPEDAEAFEPDVRNDDVGEQGEEDVT